MIKIKVPATTANMGPGFDCMGMALQLYNYLWVEKTGNDPDKRLEIELKRKSPFNIPIDETNLIYRSFCRFYAEMGIEERLPSIRMIQEDFIPLNGGLGSSAACIVAGLLAANEISGVMLPKDQIISMAARIEGHPDNSTPALAGGIIIGVIVGDKLEYIKIDNPYVRKLNIAVMIPGYQLPTSIARSILPKSCSIADAVFNMSRTGLMVAALMTGDFEKLSTAMDDRLHQPFRMKMIPGMEQIFREARSLGAYAVFLSGAGPSLIAIARDGEFERQMAGFLRTLPDRWDIMHIEPDFDGASIDIL